MRILYLDIDTLRPDHLGCYGYHRATSPNIDALAAEGVRFENVYASDTPCLPSRTSLFSGRFGIHTGVINHGGAGADVHPEGRSREFQSTLWQTCWMSALRHAGLRTVSVSTFGERHSAGHWYAGFNEVYNIGKCGGEVADEVVPHALDWLERRGAEDNWFLHVNFWDPHGEYRTPPDFGYPFEHEPVAAWYTEELRLRHWNSFGPHSAREPHHRQDLITGAAGRYPVAIDSLAAYKKWIDGYDTGIRYADYHVGLIVETLKRLGIYDEMIILFSSDHGENQGELGVYGDHQTADYCTARVPVLIKAPGLAADGVNHALYYQNDIAASLIELAKGEVPANWDGQSFAHSLRLNEQQGRDALVLGHGAWSCQRSVRFVRWLFIRTYHTGLKDYPAWMLFDIEQDPHELHNLAPERPDLVGQALMILDRWHGEMMRTAPGGIDPMDIVIQEGGPYHTRPPYSGYLLERLRKTDRAHFADRLLKEDGVPSS